VLDASDRWNATLEQHLRSQSMQIPLMISLSGVRHGPIFGPVRLALRTTLLLADDVTAPHFGEKGQIIRGINSARVDSDQAWCVSSFPSFKIFSSPCSGKTQRRNLAAFLPAARSTTSTAYTDNPDSYHPSRSSRTPSGPRCVSFPFAYSE
jgi:hypothetical protein